MALVAKQKQFCKEYVKDYNGTQAAIRAGYSAKTASVKASQLLKSPEILEKIKENQKEIVETSCLTEEKVLSKLEEVLENCMAANPVMEWNYEEHRLESTGAYQFDSKGALKAIEMLGKHLGMFDSKVKVDGEFSVGLVADILKQLEETEE